MANATPHNIPPFYHSQQLSHNLQTQQNLLLYLLSHSWRFLVTSLICCMQPILKHMAGGSLLLSSHRLSAAINMTNIKLRLCVTLEGRAYGMAGVKGDIYTRGTGGRWASPYRRTR